GATKLSANAAEVSSSEILPYTGLFAVTVGIVSIVIAFYMLRRDMKRGHLESPIQEGIPGEGALKEVQAAAQEQVAAQEQAPKQGRYAKVFAILVPIALLLVILLLIYRAIFDPDN